ncbi:hypothetical protein [Legionella israelensis]|uniref:Enhanced entry protein EnhB n=1 Tax=Legionella israelensis TaxID=454 RepID=A0A0W0V4X5_9GAMM|nr:hypothetical protein [Legionella israelensis]KTD14729.1 enhanced entry protein EnhB [Legionella israelensis]QBS09281.1 endopeptidase IV [Legionella israelensis]SCY48385.1 hypothetical protein SAMN02746069_02613 [Legionella israelensis DSM 19235]STX60175.1 enhanced entry protein EnhB [Legionella israelensis]
MKTLKNKKTGCLLGVVAWILIAGGTYAEEKEDDRFPLGCHDTGYKKQLRILTLLPGAAGERNSMYFIYNKLPESVNLYHMHDDEQHFNVYLNHKLSSKRWAVFSTNEKKVKFICTVADRHLDYGKIIDCNDALAVCEYTKVKFGLNNRGNLWIVNGNTKNGAIREVVRYGIIPAY